MFHLIKLISISLHLKKTLYYLCKQIYYTRYFQYNCNNIKNTWKGIKTIITIKNITATVPHSIEFNKKAITDPTAMSMSLIKDILCL